ncbi:MAG: acyltransferase [Flavobacteriales bacterium]
MPNNVALASQRGSSGRIFGLDVFRAVAILTVVATHGGSFLNLSRFDGFPYIKLIDGVELFFVLSGFLIGGILLDKINATEGFGPKQLVSFWKRRWLRTIPLYYLVLLLNVVFAKTGLAPNDLSQFNWRFFLFLQNFSTSFVDFFWESWSLSVEEWFYLSTPILILFALRRLNPKYAFLSVLLFMMILPIIFRFSIRDPEIDGFWFDQTFRKIVLARVDSIAYGLFAAWVLYYFPRTWSRIRVPAFLLGLVLVYFHMKIRVDVKSFYWQVVHFSLGSMAIMFLLPFANSVKKMSGSWARAVEHISRISYSMYLVNLGLVYSVMNTHFPPTGGTDAVFKYGLYWLLVISFSSLLYRYFEKPIMDLRDK